MELAPTRTSRVVAMTYATAQWTTTRLEAFVVSIVGVLQILNLYYDYLYIIRVGRCYTYEIYGPVEQWNTKMLSFR